ncbi:helix-turn-helix domain-containing protein [Providencia heimbachae]|nr:helix-turn-helix domain-containing protein [Providencia heimbachae]
MVQVEKVRQEFAKRLALACDNAGLNERGRGAVIVKALGVTSKAVSKWFNAESLPRQEKMNALAKFLRCDLVWLQHGEGEATNKGSITSIADDKYKSLRDDQIELLELYERLPKIEAEKLIRELKAKGAHYDAIFEEMLRKRGLDAS